MTDNVGIYEGIFELCVAAKQLLVDERSILDVLEKSDVQSMTRREVLEVEGLQKSHLRELEPGDAL